MATKASDDPMDLGGFMQNFVLNNPFKDLPTMPPAPPAGGTPQQRSPENASPVSNHSNALGIADTRSEGDQSEGAPELVITDRVGQVVDTPKAHVGSNVTFATALKLQQVAQPRVKVQAWLKDNYSYVSSYPGVKDTKSLLADVNEYFPHVTGIILSKVMTFTFPDCPKVTNISGCHGYRGLVAKPQPEDYCNLDLLKAASHAKTSGSVVAAADLYNVSESAVASLHYWHPDMLGGSPHGQEMPEDPTGSPPPSGGSPRRRRGGPLGEEGDREGGKDSDKDYELPQSAKRRATNANILSQTRRSKRRRHPVAKLCDDPASQSEPEDARTLMEDDLSSVSVKEEVTEEQISPSLLHTLLKGSKQPQAPSESAESLDTPLVIQVKSEPVDPGYNDQDPVTWHSASEVSPKGEVEEDQPLDMSGKSLERQVQRLQDQLATQEAENARLKRLLSTSKEESVLIKTSLIHREEAMTELVHDFSALHQQFADLTKKFMTTLTSIEQDKTKMMNASTSNASSSGKKRKSHPSKIKQNGVT